MNEVPPPAQTAWNIAAFPWFKFCQSLVFWQAVWFLYFQEKLSPGEAILLYAVYDIGTTALEVPSGYLSDRLGRRLTLIASAIAGLAGAVLLATGDSFWVFALAQILLGTSAAFASGTDNALLYESLKSQGRDDEIEQHEIRAWRFSFTALALSAISGGGLALFGGWLPFAMGALAYGAVLLLCLSFSEPPRKSKLPGPARGQLHFSGIRAAFAEPVLVWLFILSLVMYIFSHIPFVFGQPFILEALGDSGFEADAPLVSGAVTTVMMALSVGTSLIAPALRQRLGLMSLLLFAFGMQIALNGILALSNETIIITILFLRMVPDSFSKPFMVARIQPLLQDESRATYLSLQSFCGRLVFAATLFLVAGSASDSAQMPYDEIQIILGRYVVVGIITLVLLALTGRRLQID